MCLAIPGQIVEFTDATQQFAVVDVSGVKRKINVDLLRDEPLSPGDWVLIHVGFAMSAISKDRAQEQLRLLAMFGEDSKAMEELNGYTFGSSEGSST